MARAPIDRQTLLIEQARDIHQVLNLASSFFVQLPEQEIVRRGLLMANNCTGEEKAEVIVMMDGLVSHGFSNQNVQALAAFWKSPKMQPELHEIWEEMAADRALFRQSIELAYENPNKARLSLNSQMEAAIKDIVAIPHLRWSAGRMISEVRYWALSRAAVFGYLLMILLDRDKNLVAALQRCKLDGCGRYFLSLPSESGGRPPLYCNPYHQSDASNAKAALRMRRVRAKRPRKAK